MKMKADMLSAGSISLVELVVIVSRSRHVHISHGGTKQPRAQRLPRVFPHCCTYIYTYFYVHNMYKLT